MASGFVGVGAGPRPFVAFGAPPCPRRSCGTAWLGRHVPSHFITLSKPRQLRATEGQDGPAAPAGLSPLPATSLPRIQIPEHVSRRLNALNERYRPPKYLWRSVAAFIIAGEAALRIARGRIHWRNTLQQLHEVGPRSLGVCLLTSFFLGMVFTIQFIRRVGCRDGCQRNLGGWVGG